jgi:hypothetical protein
MRNPCAALRLALVLLFTTLAVVLGVATPATASPSNVTLTVVVESGPDQAPNFGEMITFAFNSPADHNWVSLWCYQAGVFVYSNTGGFNPDGYYAPDFTLSSAYWTAGGADCHARLYTQAAKAPYHQTTLGELDFVVQP